jgi:hypothetical protein
MKKLAFMIAALICAAPAYAQFGKLGDIANKAAKVKKIADIKVTAQEERLIGQQVSDKIVEEFGVYQDRAVNKYVTLVGSVLAQASSRPDLDWQFIVLDTEGVNAFAAPGGFVHITKGLLGLRDVLAKLAGRMGSRTEKSGMFASHPVIKDRIAKIDQTIKSKKLSATATVATRYTGTIKFDAKPIDDVALVPEGSRGLAGGEAKKEGESKPAESKPKSGGGLGGALSKLSGGDSKQAQQSQTVASAGARGLSPDRDAGARRYIRLRRQTPDDVGGGRSRGRVRAAGHAWQRVRRPRHPEREAIPRRPLDQGR